MSGEHESKSRVLRDCPGRQDSSSGASILLARALTSLVPPLVLSSNQLSSGLAGRFRLRRAPLKSCAAANRRIGWRWSRFCAGSQPGRAPEIPAGGPREGNGRSRRRQHRGGMICPAGEIPRARRERAFPGPASPSERRRRRESARHPRNDPELEHDRGGLQDPDCLIK